MEYCVNQICFYILFLLGTFLEKTCSLTVCMKIYLFIIYIYHWTKIENLDKVTRKGINKYVS